MSVEALIWFEVGCRLLILDVVIIDGRLSMFVLNTTHEDRVRFLYQVEKQAWPPSQME